jgi:hypothetical protein
LRRLPFGGQILLRPELLDSYASVIVEAARNDPSGLGVLEEDSILYGDFRMAASERIEVEEERYILVATLDELLRHELAYREVSEGVTRIVFPAQSMREYPRGQVVPRVDAVIVLRGAVRNIYSSLVVRLRAAESWRSSELFRDRAVFESASPGRCGVLLREMGDGLAELLVFYDQEVNDEQRSLFERQIVSILSRGALRDSVELRRVIRCPDCDYEFPSQLIDALRARGREKFRCLVCEQAVVILPKVELCAKDAVEDIQKPSDRQKLAAVESAIRSKRDKASFDVFFSYHSIDRPQVLELGRRLQSRGILPWVDIWEIAPGEHFQDRMTEQIKHIAAVAVLIGRDGLGPWQDVEQKAFISEFVERRVLVVPVILADSPEIINLPTLLKQWQAVDFRVSEPDPFEQLVWGLTGQRPQF